MKTFLWFSLGIVMAVTLAACSSGGGGGGGTQTQTSVIKLPKTGQTTSYDTGAIDDGALQRGVAWPSPRFTNPDGTTPVTGSVVVDRLTGLMWLQDANCFYTSYASFDTDWTPGDGSVTWQHALDFIAGINNGTYPNCRGGHTDWRLPNKKELRSLINYGTNSQTWLNTQGFSNVQGSYWSSSTYAANTTLPWIITMYDGLVRPYSGSYYVYVWPVRSGQ